MRPVSTRIDQATRDQLTRQAAEILGVPTADVFVHAWDEMFPNTGGPARQRGMVVGQAFTPFEVLGFEADAAARKIKCCVYPHNLERNVWENWSGTPDDHVWTKEEFK